MTDHINSIPRILSHYLRAQTTREYIDGSRTITEIYRDYVDNQKQTDKKEPIESLTSSTRYSIQSLILAFLSKKKCDLCNQYLLCPEDKGPDIQEKYDTHLEEKVSSRGSYPEKKSENIVKTLVISLFAQFLIFRLCCNVQRAIFLPFTINRGLTVFILPQQSQINRRKQNPI